jgi:hypothetical protein
MWKMDRPFGTNSCPVPKFWLTPRVRAGVFGQSSRTLASFPCVSQGDSNALVKQELRERLAFYRRRPSAWRSATAFASGALDSTPPSLSCFAPQQRGEACVHGGETSCAG